MMLQAAATEIEEEIAKRVAAEEKAAYFEAKLDDAVEASEALKKEHEHCAVCFLDHPSIPAAVSLEQYCSASRTLPDLEPTLRRPCLQSWLVGTV